MAYTWYSATLILFEIIRALFCFSSGFVVYFVDVFRLPGKPFTRIFIYPDVDSTKQECKCFHTKDSMTIPKIKIVIDFYIFKGYGDKLYTRFAFLVNI